MQNNLFYKKKNLSDLMTANRVLLLKSQLMIQKKNIPDSINHLSNTLKEEKEEKEVKGKVQTQAKNQRIKNKRKKINLQI